MVTADSQTAMRGSRFTARKSTRKAILIWSFLAPSLVIFLLYRILPLGWNVLLSFQAWSPMKPAVFIGLDNYRRLWSDPEFLDSLWVTLRFVTVSVASSHTQP